MISKPFENDALLSALTGAGSILLCTHLHPDGDAAGSLLAAGQILSAMGKRVALVCEDLIPEKLAFLPFAAHWRTPVTLEKSSYDLALALDAADEKRLGACADLFFSCPKTALIDHHPTNIGYAQYNEIDGDASSAGVMVWRMARALNAPITRDIAACLYTAVSSDTGNFCFRNTDAEAFACAAAMADTGLDVGAIAQKIHLTLEEKHVRLLGRALNTLQLFADGRAAGMMLRARDYEETGALDEHTDKIVNYAKNIPGVEIAFLADDHLGYTKFSLRASPPRDVAAIAQQYGGGGHVLAAGCKMNAPLEDACETMRREIEKRLGAG